MTPTGGGGVELRGMLREPASRLLEALPAEPATDRRRRGERWLVFELDDLSVRVRCEESQGGESGKGGRVASWTATFRRPPASLRAAAELVGMWPELAPDADAAGSSPMIRRPLPAGDGETVHSVTAAVRDGGIVQMTAFDEPPDWM